MIELEEVLLPKTTADYGFTGEDAPLIEKIIEPCLDYDGHLSHRVGAAISASYDLKLFNLATRASKGEYTGGTWDMVILSNGAWFLSLPLGGSTFPLNNNMNYCDETAGPVGFSIALNICLQHQVGMHFYEKGDEKMANDLFGYYYALRDAACDHAEARAILRYID